MTVTNGINYIPDAGCATSLYASVPILISGLPTTLGTAPGNAIFQNVQLIAAHTFNGDMQVTLTSPSGATRNLILNKFGSGDNLGNPATCPTSLLTLQDGGTALTTTATNNVTGTYAPEQTLAGFTGNPNGVWLLNVCDNAAADVGSIRCVKLNFCASPTATFTAVDNCGSNQFNVQVNVTSLGTSPSANLSYTVNGSTPVNMTGLGSGITTIGPFAVGSEIIATLSGSVSGCGSVQGVVYSNCPMIIPCGNTVVVNHCYRNNDTRTFLFTSSSAFETVTLSFIAGSIAVNDVITFYDGTDNNGTVLTGNGYSNVVLTGLSITSISNSMFVEISSDGSNSCATGQQTSWQMEVECTAGCEDPDGVVVVNMNCAGYNFDLDVEIESVGDGSNGTTTLRYTVNGGAPVLIPGLVQFQVQNIGPFLVDDVVNVRLLHGDSPLCDKNLGDYTDDNSCPSAETCANALNLAGQTSPLPGTTIGRTHEFSFVCGTATANTAPDAIYFMDVPNGAQFNIRQQSNNYDSQHYLRFGGACPGTTAIACVDDDNAEVGWVMWTNTTGTTQRVWWIQDGFGALTGNFVLEWQLVGCPVAPGPPSLGTSSYTICQNGSVPGGQGLSATCASVAQTATTSFPGNNFNSEGTTLTTQVTLTMPALPVGAVVTGARLKLFNVVAQTFFGIADAQRQNIRVALSGAYVLGETQLTTATGPGVVSPDPVINLPGFPAAGGTINLRTRQTADQAFTNPDAVITSATIEVDYTVLPAVRWYSAPISGTLVFTGSLFDPVGQGAVNNATPGTTNFYPTCGYNACENIRLTSSFMVNAAANAGIDGTLTICSNAAPASLIAQLGGSPNGGGSWSGPSTVAGGLYNPTTMDPGVYTYLVNGNPPCPNASATVSVTENTAVNWYADADGDGFGSGAGTLACAAPNVGDVTNNTDNCPGASNAGQEDADADGLGDACDTCPLDAANDSDGDGVCGNVDNCPTVSNANQLNFDGDALGDACDTDDDNDGLSDVAEAGAGTNPLDPDTDDDSFLDGADNCPLVFGQIGNICDANSGPGFALGELNANCVCAAATCTQNLTIEFQSDQNPGQNTWELREQGTNVLVRQDLVIAAVGVPFGIGTANTCVPNGCYYLRVLDSGGDGMSVGANGGYTLRSGAVLPGSLPSNQRIIDNRNNFLGGSVSQIAGGEGFCVPFGSTTTGIYTACDKLDWLASGEYYVCSPMTAVSNLWNAGNLPAEAITGYEFWFFNPNGGYSFRKFRSHDVSDGFSPDNATRACHIKINNWAAGNQIPANVLMNVRVRTRVNGVYGQWGTTCRFKIDPVRAACPLTKLMDIPGDPNLSCGSTRVWGTGNFIHARPVTGATQYQWRFRIDGESFISIRTTTTYFVQLNWVTLPLQDGKTYQVEVRAYKNGAWCIDAPTPTFCGFSNPCFTQWGTVCDLTIDNSPANGGNENSLTAEEPSAGLRMYPNPNRGDQLYLQLDAVEAGVTTVSVDIFDLTGKRVSARTIAVNDSFIKTVLDLDGNMASGMYMVNITAGEKTYTERLVIQK